jgi:hypothetical protein
VDVSSIDSYSDFTSWAGTRQGLYVQGAGNAWFDLYIYRDAFTPILAECPANQYGTSKVSAGSGISVLDNIHHNDWALYAGVEFGTGDDFGIPDSVEFTASSATTGGTVEIWLDSIGTGTKIAECKINSTGSWYTFKQFTAKVTPVTGNHDVYLKFSGSGTNKLFLLKWMKFIKKSGSINSSSGMRTVKQDNLSIYPNPVKNRLSIFSGFQYNRVEIYNMSGKMVFLDKNAASHSSILNLNLANGLYILKVSSEKNSASSRFIIDSKDSHAR